MKIAIVLPLFLPKWLGGTELATYHIAKCLAARGHDVHIVTSLDKGSKAYEERDDFLIHRIIWPRIRILGTLCFWLRATIMIKSIAPDIVHLQVLTTGVSGILAKKLFSVPFIACGQGADIYFPRTIDSLLLRLTLREADLVIAKTTDMKKTMQRYGATDVTIVPNGINYSSFAEHSKSECREVLNIGTAEKIVLFIGSLRPVKGVGYLIRAMAEMKEQLPNARLIIVGDGDEKQELIQLTKRLDLESITRFTGIVNNEKIPIYTTASDLFVLPSVSEGFGIVVLEAMASGLPIIASNVTGLVELVEDGANGFLVEPKDPAQIAKRAVAILQDECLLAKMSAANKKKASDYDWKKIAETFESAYDSARKHEIHLRTEGFA